MLFCGDFGVGELLEACDQRTAEALETVAVLGDGGAFADIEVIADFFVGVDTVIEIGDERGDSASK